MNVSKDDEMKYSVRQFIDQYKDILKLSDGELIYAENKKGISRKKLNQLLFNHLKSILYYVSKSKNICDIWMKHSDKWIKKERKSQIKQE